MSGLRIFAGPRVYHLLGNVISATVALVCINVPVAYSGYDSKGHRWSQWSPGAETLVTESKLP